MLARYIAHAVSVHQQSCWSKHPLTLPDCLHTTSQHLLVNLHKRFSFNQIAHLWPPSCPSPQPPPAHPGMSDMPHNPDYLFWASSGSYDDCNVYDTMRCGFAYSDSGQAAYCAVPQPSSWPAMMQVTPPLAHPTVNSLHHFKPGGGLPPSAMLSRALWS